MLNFMETIIHAIKSWVKHDAFTTEDAIEILADNDFIQPFADVTGTVYTSANGAIYTFD